MARKTLVAALMGAALGLGACTQPDDINLSGQDVHLTLLHTTDIHSRLLPYDLEVGEVDLRLGLAQELEPFGGAARVAYLLDRERGRSGRVLHLDSGDIFQGAPIFNYFRGEPEMRLLTEIQADAMAIGNHEFDMGGANLYDQIDRWSAFPTLAANYMWDDPELPYNSRLGRVSNPYVVMNVQGLRVGVIGLANLSSMNSIYDTGNRLGVTPLDPIQTTQFYVDLIRPTVDIVVVLAHMGLHMDETLLEEVQGIDVLLGGHHHVVLNPPKIVEDPSGRHVIMAHSGAFAKYVGRLDVVLRQCHRIPECDARYREQEGHAPPDNDWEVVSHEYQVIPVDSTVPEHPEIARLLEDYVTDMSEQVDLNQLIGYAPWTISRFSSTGGDSPLGNLVAESILLRQGVQTDFALTNSLGIRANFDPGPVSVEEMFNVFPFENTITTLYLSGAEVQEMFDFIARRSAGRGCNTQAQIAGAAVEMDCGDVCPPERVTPDGGCEVPLEPRVRRVLVGDASPVPEGAAQCTDMSDRFHACCDEIAGCGCDDELCFDSQCERDARAAVPGCDERYEPYWANFEPGFPFPCQSDEQCMERGENQRCFYVPTWEIGRCMYAVVDDYVLLDPYGAYELAANDYIAAGGSGFRVLGRNTTQENLEIPLRDAVIDHIRGGPPCTANYPCTTSAECRFGQICACDAVSELQGGDCWWYEHGMEPRIAESDAAPACEGTSGHCILAACALDVAEYRAERITTCDEGDSAEARERCWCDAGRWALEECQTLACISDRVGAYSEGRIRMVQP